MKTTTKLSLSLAVLALIGAADSTALADGPVRKAEAIIVTDFLTTPDGALDSPNDLLYDLDMCDGVTPNPVLAPDGHHLTLGEYARVQGWAYLKCGKKGTHVVMHLSGLVPNGVYTIWLLPFAAPGFDGTFDNLIGEGSLGAPDGTQNIVVASRKGRAVVHVRQPAGNLSEFGSVGPCLFDEFEFHLVGAYHPDGKTYGPTPGPLANPDDPVSVQYCYFVEHFAFVFVPGRKEHTSKDDDGKHKE